MPFGLSAGEMIVLFLVAVLVFGGKLPEVARNVGRTLAELRRSWHREVSEFERIEPPAPASPSRTANGTDDSDTGEAEDGDVYAPVDDDEERPPPGWTPPPDGEDCPGP